MLSSEVRLGGHFGPWSTDVSPHTESGLVSVPSRGQSRVFDVKTRSVDTHLPPHVSSPALRRSHHVRRTLRQPCGEGVLQPGSTKLPRHGRYRTRTTTRPHHFSMLGSQKQ
jgi:hypothetical protein